MTAVLERPSGGDDPEAPKCRVRPGMDKKTKKKKPRCGRTMVKVGTPTNWVWFCLNCDQLAKTPYEHLNRLVA